MEGGGLLARGVRAAAAFVCELDGGKIPLPMSIDDRITERRRGELMVERTVPAKRNGGHPTISVRRGLDMLVVARLAPGWEDSDLRIEIVQYASEIAWIATLTDRGSQNMDLSIGHTQRSSHTTAPYHTLARPTYLHDLSERGKINRLSVRPGGP